MTRTSIHTRSGLPFDPFGDDDSQIRIKDIAAALSRTCRWRGQFKEGVRFYSVAEHSVRVADALPSPYKLLGLMHDAGEWVFGDVPSPVKNQMPEFCEAEERLLKRILNRFGVDQSAQAWEYVHHVDKLVAYDEAERFLVPAKDSWWTRNPPAPLHGVRVEGLERSGYWTQTSREAERSFLKRFKELTSVA